MRQHSLILCLLAAGLFAASGVHADSRQLDPAEVQVEDGDTLLVKTPTAWQKIQLYGIDAPENTDNPKFKVDRQRTGLDEQTLLSLGHMAASHLRDLIARSQGLELEFTPGQVDRYGRQLARLRSAEGGGVNRRMIADGFAVATLPEGAPETADWLQAQTTAMDEKHGLWGLLREPAMQWAGAHARP